MMCTFNCLPRFLPRVVRVGSWFIGYMGSDPQQRHGRIIKVNFWLELVLSQVPLAGWHFIPLVGMYPWWFMATTLLVLEMRMG